MPEPEEEILVSDPAADATEGAFAQLSENVPSCMECSWAAANGP